MDQLQKTKRQRIYSWDYIRVLAMMSIILFHWNAYIPEKEIDGGYLFVPSGMPVANLAVMGVSLFFILSGASLMLTTQDHFSLKKYYKKRALAIFPIYYLIYASTFICYYVVRGVVRGAPLSSLFLTLIGMDGYLFKWIPCLYLIGEWFVGCIILIYLIYPVLRWCVLRHPVITAIAAAAVFIPLSFVFPQELDVSRFFVMRIPDVLIGMYFCRFLYPGGKNAGAFRGKISSLVFIIVCGAVFVWSMFRPWEGSNFWGNLITGTSCFLFLSALFGTFVRRTPHLNRFMGWLSGKSFAIFLLHHVLIDEFLKRYAGIHLSLRHNVALFVLYLVCLVAISVCMTYLCDCIVKGIGRLFSRKRTGEGKRCADH